MTEEFSLTHPDLDIDADRGFRTWHEDEIFKGDPTDRNARFVPNINDMVISWKGGNFTPYYVSFVDANYLSTLVPAKMAKEPDDLGNDNVLIGQGVGAVNEAYRCYINTKTVPFTLTPSGLLHMYGSDVAYCKIFRGTDTTENGDVISKFYDENGTYQGENLPMEKVRDADGKNKYIYTIRPGHCNVKLNDGEMLTAVFYSDTGIIHSTAPLLSWDTTLIRDSNAPTKEIIGLRLESDFLSPHDETVLEIPLNLPVSSIMANARIFYNDGTDKPVQIDGSKCILHGLRGYIASVPDISYPLTLTYRLSPGESTSIATPGEVPHIDKPYRIVTKNPDRINAVKLFMVPYFANEVEGYKLKWWLHDLERSEPIDVTQHVVLQEANNFNGVDYGKIQHVMMTLDLKSVGSEFMDFRVVQDMDIMLRGAPDGTADGFWIRYEEGTGWYGEDIGAWATIVDGKSVLDIDQGHQFSDGWLDIMYRRNCPMPDLDSNLVAPRPTHVHLKHGGNKVTVEVEKFKDSVNWPVQLSDTDVLTLEWVQRTSSNELFLASTPLLVKNQ